MTTKQQNSLHNKTLKRKRRVLVVEDQRDLADLLVYNLQRAGYEAAAAYDGRSALDQTARSRPDLILLDLMLPELSGTEIATKIRTNPTTADIPIIMLTAKSDELDQLLGLSLGADDYVTKPFSTKVLLARVEAVLRRASESGSSGGPSLRLGPIEVNTETHEARVDGQIIHLTLTEFRLLSAMIQANGRVLSRQHLMTKAMGPGITVTDRTIDVHMTSIRKKLGDHADVIRTVRGVGYRATRDADPGEV